MAVKAINNIVEYNGLISILLIFGAYFRISKNKAPSLITYQRAKAIKRAISEISKLHAFRQIKDALNQRNGPETTKIHDISIGSQIIIWREYKHT